MIMEGKFGVQEAICLLTITIVSKAFFTSPAMVMKAVGTAGWYMTLISAITAVAAFTPVYLLLKRFPGNNIMEIYNTVLGNTIGSLFTFSLFLIVLVTTAINIREFAEVLVVYVYPLSPPLYIIVLLYLLIILAAYLGLESLARMSRLSSGFLLFGIFALLISASQNYQFHRLFPILGYGIGTTLYNGVLRSSAYGEITIIAVIAKSLQGISHVKKAGYMSLIISGTIITTVLFAFTLTFPYYTGREAMAPLYLFTTLIDYGPFFQRLEAMFLFIWSTSHAISSSVLFYITLMLYSHIFKIEDKKPLIIPLSLISLSLTMIPENMIVLITVYLQALRSYGWIFFFIPPMLTFLIAIVRGKKGGVANAQRN